MQKSEILVIGELPQATVSELGETFSTQVLPPGLSENTLNSLRVKDIRGIAAGLGARVKAELISQLPQLEIIASFGVGYDKIDVATAAQRGIVVTNTPDVLTEEVADSAVGLLLATVLRIPQGDTAVHRQIDLPADASLPSLYGRTVGILGLGRIGLAIARRLAAFNCRIIYHNRHPRSDVPYNYVASAVELARTSHILLVATPGGKETNHMVDARVLEALGPNGILINVSRGSVVDEGALVEALKTKAILAAGLDVYENEPHVPDELIKLDSVVILPHVGSATVYTRNEMGQLVVRNLTSWFSHHRPITPVPETPVSQFRNPGGSNSSTK